MRFEKIKRVEYKKNTLFEVVFQARFPEIYSIADDLHPTKFQDKIRQNGYPESRIQYNSSMLPPDLAEEIKKIVKSEKVFFFLSEIGDWQISLSNSYISLASLGHYTRYTDFKTKLEVVLNIFHDIYNPTYYNRVGLRYRNIINQTVLEDDIAINDCIPEHIAPELSSSIEKDLKHFEKLFSFDDGEINANVRHYLTIATGKFGGHSIDNEKSYIVDIDCYVEDKIRENVNAIRKCDTFNESIRNIFRWSITDKLHAAMEPKPSQ